MQARPARGVCAAASRCPPPALARRKTAHPHLGLKIEQGSATNRTGCQVSFWLPHTNHHGPRSQPKRQVQTPNEHGERLNEAFWRWLACQGPFVYVSLYRFSIKSTQFRRFSQSSIERRRRRGSCASRYKAGVSEVPFRHLPRLAGRKLRPLAAATRRCCGATPCRVLRPRSSSPLIATVRDAL